MAKSILRQDSLKLQIECDTASLDEHIAYYLYLCGSRFTTAYGDHMRGGGIEDRLTEQARQVVRRVVYSYTPKTPASEYQRSENLLNSMRALSYVGDSLANFSVLSDITIPGIETRHSPRGTAQWIGSRKNFSAELLSYAAFFLDFKTFIKPSGKPRRDLFKPLVNDSTRILKRQQKQAIIEALTANKPA